MKNSHKLLCCIVALSIASITACKKKKDEVATAKQNLIGTWILVDVAVDSNQNNIKDANEYGIAHDNDTFILNSDGTITNIGDTALSWVVVDSKNMFIILPSPASSEDTLKALIVSPTEFDIYGSGIIPPAKTVTQWFIFKKI